ncbi:MAG: MATE family efflux transporter [Muribaculaceae bacterium]|nr:MATE family efflux transporter [Muribaculaceae bacterium]
MANSQDSSSAKTTSALETRSITRLLVEYSLPAIIASVATSLYNIVDSIFIGRGVGAMAIAGLAITFPLMNLVIAFCMLIAAGGAAITSIFLGQKNITRATDVLKNVTLLSLVHSVVFGGITLIYLDPILTFFGATPATLPYAHEFMRVILYGTPISFIFISLNNLMRATGYPRKAMISALISVVVNIVLAPIFIFHLQWGIQGAALATIFGQLVSCVWVVAHFLHRSNLVNYHCGGSWFNRSICKHIYSIGMSPFLMNVCACIVVVFINRALLEHGGTDPDMAIGAYGIINRTTMFFIMIVFGITQGMQPILGYNYGANLMKRVKSTLRIGIWVGISITTFGWLITEIFPDQVSSLFTVDKTLIDITRTGFRIFFLFYPIVGAQIVIQNFFQSIGHPVYSIFLSLTRQLIFLLPGLWILPPIFGIDGVWSAMAISDLLAFLVALGSIIYVSSSRSKVLKAAKAQAENK